MDCRRLIRYIVAAREERKKEEGMEDDGGTRKEGWKWKKSGEEKGWQKAEEGNGDDWSSQETSEDKFRPENVGGNKLQVRQEMSGDRFKSMRDEMKWCTVMRRKGEADMRRSRWMTMGESYIEGQKWRGKKDEAWNFIQEFEMKEMSCQLRVRVWCEVWEEKIGEIKRGGETIIQVWRKGDKRIYAREETQCTKDTWVRNTRSKLSSLHMQWRNLLVQTYSNIT